MIHGCGQQGALDAAGSPAEAVVAVLGIGNSGVIGSALTTTSLFTAAVFTLVKRFEPAFTRTVGLTAISIVSMLPVLMMPRPWLFTILFFTIELKLLLSARATGNIRALWYLPFLFALWANLRISAQSGLPSRKVWCRRVMFTSR